MEVDYFNKPIDDKNAFKALKENLQFDDYSEEKNLLQNEINNIRGNRDFFALTTVAGGVGTLTTVFDILNPDFQTVLNTEMPAWAKLASVAILAAGAVGVQRTTTALYQAQDSMNSPLPYKSLYRSLHRADTKVVFEEPTPSFEPQVVPVYYK